MLYEYRVYTVELGKQQQMIKTIEEFIALAEKHGVKGLGVFHPIIGSENELSYFLIYESMAHREKAWQAFATDPALGKWMAAVRERAEREGGSGLINTANTLLSSTEYSSGK